MGKVRVPGFLSSRHISSGLSPLKIPMPLTSRNPLEVQSIDIPEGTPGDIANVRVIGGRIIPESAEFQLQPAWY